MSRNWKIGLYIFGGLVVLGAIGRLFGTGESAPAEEAMPTAQVVAAADTATPETPVEVEDQLECQAATDEQIATINSFIESEDPANHVEAGFAVRSPEFEQVWMVSAMIYGPGMESGAGPGTWAISGDPSNPGLTLAVDGFAKEFSVAPDAAGTDAQITLDTAGVSEAIRCAAQ